jgi:endonuclease III
MKWLNKKQQFVKEALTIMDQMFSWYPLTELLYKTPFQLLVAVIMSAQTTDKQVNKVNEQFFRAVSRPEDIVALGEAWVGQMIKTVGLWKSKTVNLVKMATKLTMNNEQLTIDDWQLTIDDWQLTVDDWQLTVDNGQLTMKNVGADTIRPNIREQQRQYVNAQELYNERWYLIPDTIEEMVQLPGVWIKTAKVVLYILYGQRRVAVDTHVHRVMNRLGIVETNTPEQTSKLLEVIIPDDFKPLAHKVIIYFWRYNCTAINPKCNDCPLQKQCPWFKKKNN